MAIDRKCERVDVSNAMPIRVGSMLQNALYSEPIFVPSYLHQERFLTPLGFDPGLI